MDHYLSKTFSELQLLGESVPTSKFIDDSIFCGDFNAFQKKHINTKLLSVSSGK